MNSATLMQIKVVAAKLVSVLTLLALVVAPACAPLCAAQACALAPSAVGTESHCGLSGATGEGAVHLHAVRSCGAPQAQAANLTYTNWRESLQKDRAPFSAGGVGILFAAQRFSSQNHSTVRGAPSRPPESSRFPADVVVLRI